jgi:protocatechuate 3,4-dioxygenase beta subunit
MKRKDFLKAVGLTGVGLGLATSRSITKAKATSPNNACTLIPSETAGPFPLDLSDNTFYLRQDVREDREGAQLNLKMRIIGSENCEPMPNVRVNIWHCDKDGNYSGYNTQNGQTYLRGYQMTDANGEADFITVFPGWYNGRVCHIHFQVYVSANYAAISQLTFDHDTTNQIYDDFSELYTKGEDPLTPSTDNIFSDGYELQLADLTYNEAEEAYEAYLEVTVQGLGTVGLSNIEKETTKHLVLKQNIPNPFKGQTTIPFEVKTAAAVSIGIWNLDGQQVAKIEKGRLVPGNYSESINLSDLGLTQGSYLYQVEAINNEGKFTSYKMMTGL